MSGHPPEYSDSGVEASVPIGSLESTGPEAHFPSPPPTVGPGYGAITNEGSSSTTPFRREASDSLSGCDEDERAPLMPLPPTRGKNRPTSTTRRKDTRERGTIRAGRSTTRWQQLHNLKELLREGFISQDEYGQRKAQLVDDLTGTSIVPDAKPTSPGGRTVQTLRQVVPHPPPDFSLSRALSATQHTFDIKTGTWSADPITVKLDPQPFARGGLRYAIHMQIVSEPGTKYVAKCSIDPYEDRDVYFQDVELQMYCRQWADMYNHYRPPKRVDFVAAWLLTVAEGQGPDEGLYVVERYIEGDYQKHNNNAGFVDPDDRNTPQAFSHFTYEASRHSVLVCDIQGVSDLYTDPQMHTLDGWGFGKGNLGVKGFEHFLKTHRCNAICHYLRLPSVNRKMYDAGTMPAQRMMENPLEVHLPPLPPHALTSSSTQKSGSNQQQSSCYSSCCCIL